MSRAALAYRADIDGLRAIAVGLVVIFHFELVPLGKAGFIGVDIFFVISGFLITRIILDGLRAGQFRLSGFYLARIRRLYPALIATLVLYLAAAYVLFLPDLFRELSIEAALSQLYVVNIYFWQEVNYFGLQAKNVPLLHMWSLAVEEQFYLIYPLFLMFLHRFLRRWMVPVLVGITLASFLLGWVASGWKPQASFYLLPTRAWELGVGGLVALVPAQFVPRRWICVAGGFAGLGLIGVTIALHRPDLPWPGWFAAVPVAGAALLILSGGQTKTPVNHLLSIAPMVAVGRLSYPLYLVHWPVIILMLNVLPDPGWSTRLAGLALSVVLAWAIMRFVEAPVRSRRVLLRTKPLLAVVTLCTAALLVVSVLGVRSAGFPGRFSPEVSRLLAYAQDQSVLFERCEWPAAPCVLGSEGPPGVAVIGDSHAWALAPALELWLRNTGRSGTLSFASSCLPVAGTGGDRCADFIQSRIAQIEADPSVHTVLFVSIWRQPYEGPGFVVDGKFRTGEAAHAGFAKALVAMVERLRAQGKTAIIVEPLYAAPHAVPATMARNLAFGNDWPVDASLADHVATFGKAYGAFDQAEAAGARRISFIDGLCVSGTCPGTVNGAPLFFDNNHLRAGVAPVFSALLDDSLTPLN